MRAAEPRARRALDVPDVIRSTTDGSRAGRYWSLILEHAGVTAPAETLEQAWAELTAYHARHNLWQNVLAGVPEALDRLRSLGLKLIAGSAWPRAPPHVVLSHASA